MIISTHTADFLKDNKHHVAGISCKYMFYEFQQTEMSKNDRKALKARFTWKKLMTLPHDNLKNNFIFQPAVQGMLILGFIQHPL